MPSWSWQILLVHTCGAAPPPHPQPVLHTESFQGPARRPRLPSFSTSSLLTATISLSMLASPPSSAAIATCRTVAKGLASCSRASRTLLRPTY
ncbi:hypothetical protein BJ912DRAFT_1144669 [Pholiota molesta]|nr:hypothetical protein BJ912DRAFT_1144669 [Pholiota molesta]